ncbi:MAG: hypothetical protein K2N86_05660 [Rikenellaceae bacterium]|nr:hypothetical protein [Rikenellaceae bacterium]MDE7355930.1 hypothetical protein [Rikenellaceae bacterium]
MSELVVIKSFSRRNEALVVKSLLDSFGFQTQLSGEESAALFPNSPIGDLDIKIVARAEDADKIKEILADNLEQ